MSGTIFEKAENKIKDNKVKTFNVECFYKTIDTKFLRDEDPNPWDVINQFLDDFTDEFVTCEEKGKNTIYLRVSEGGNEFLAHCKKIAPLKDYMVERLELADCKRIKTIKNILADVTDYSSFSLVINDINNIIKEDEIEFYIFKNGYKK